MLQPLQFQSEKYSAYGNATSQGILNQLGRPALDSLSILIRETVQNSWDARISNSIPVKFQVAGRILTDNQLQFLHDTILKDAPATLNLHSTLFSGKETPVLIISDRGTTGLNGPTRADVPDGGSEERNFVNFFRNVGQSKSKRSMGGGTYGYGKSVLYRVSRVHTVCVYTRCLVNGELQSRFIAAALEPEAEEQKNNSLLTGRHWWGLLADNVIEPVTGDKADAIASALGLPDFDKDERGTSCMILLPDFGENTMEDILKRTTRILLWYFWPKMLESQNSISPMEFEVFNNKSRVFIPAPNTFPPIQGFILAMQTLKRDGLSEKEDYMKKVTRIRSPRLGKDLGWLVLQRFAFEARVDLDPDSADMFSPFSGVCHHVALMRRAELVVKYLPGPPLVSPQIEYAGVFLVDEDVDQAFAKAEPPTHDDWNSQSLTGQEKTVVNVALNNIKRALDNFATPLPTSSKSSVLSPLGTFADQLGSLLIGQDGPGGYVQSIQERKSGKSNGSQGAATGSGDISGQDTGIGHILSSENHAGNDRSTGGVNDLAPGENTKRSHARIKLIDKGRLDLIEDMPASVIEFQIEHAIPSHATKVIVEANVVLDSGEQEKEAPTDGEKPDVLLWMDADGRVRSGSEAIVISSADTRSWKVAISIPTNTLLNIDLFAEEIF